MASLQADARTFFSGDSSAGPGVYGSSGYMQSLEQQVGASRSTNRKQEAKLKKLEEELHNCRDRLSRSMVISDGNRPSSRRAPPRPRPRSAKSSRRSRG